MAFCLHFWLLCIVQLLIVEAITFTFLVLVTITSMIWHVNLSQGYFCNFTSLINIINKIFSPFLNGYRQVLQDIVLGLTILHVRLLCWLKQLPNDIFIKAPKTVIFSVNLANDRTKRVVFQIVERYWVISPNLRGVLIVFP